MREGGRRMKKLGQWSIASLVFQSFLKSNFLTSVFTIVRKTTIDVDGIQIETSTATSSRRGIRWRLKTSCAKARFSSSRKTVSWQYVSTSGSKEVASTTQHKNQTDPLIKCVVSEKTTNGLSSVFILNIPTQRNKPWSHWQHGELLPYENIYMDGIPFPFHWFAYFLGTSKVTLRKMWFQCKHLL